MIIRYMLCGTSVKVRRLKKSRTELNYTTDRCLSIGPYKTREVHDRQRRGRPERSHVDDVERLLRWAETEMCDWVRARRNIGRQTRHYRWDLEKRLFEWGDSWN